jgi:hypothetical protein
MHMPHRLERIPLALVALVGVSVALLVVSGGSDGSTPPLRRPPAAWQGLVGAPRPEVAIGQRMLVVLKAPSLADQLAAAGGVATESQERAWTAAALATQASLLAFLTANGVFVQPEFRYARVLNGFSAPLDPRAIGLLERSPDVAGVYPVRAAYPATVPAELLRDRRSAGEEGLRPAVELPGHAGGGVTIALLDTGVDSRHPFLRGALAPGYDVIGQDSSPEPARSPEDQALVERHGTEMAGLLVGNHGPGGLIGVAPGATVMPLRVAGWQPDAAGHFSVYARTDQLVEGLERAVDPNGDGDAHDGARIAVVPLVVPFAGFDDSPEARAVDGALALDTLVVVPAGNDGEAGPEYGSISGPGGAAGALTVGALDGRRRIETAQVVLRRGLDVLLDRPSPLLNVVALPSSATFAPAAPREVDASGALSFTNARGFSIVARRAALVPAGGDPTARARAAARAGAAVVVLYGDRLPAGGLGLDEQLNVPVVSIPPAPALALLAAQRAGASVGVSLGSASGADNPGRGRVATFSSRGLAFDGRVKPELVAPGVALATSEPEGGYGTVNGSSVSAAIVAGAAARLAEARPVLDAAGLEGLLAGTARRVPGSTLAQGGGVVDLGAATAAEVASEPTSLGFGTWTGKGWSSAQTIVVRNLSTRRLRVGVAARPEGGESEFLAITIEPRAFVLRQGRRQKVTVTMRAAAKPAEDVASGSLVVAPEGGRATRVPWAVGFRPSRQPLIAGAKLSAQLFSPSDRASIVLSFRAGRVDLRDGVPELRPVSRVDVRLIRADGHWLGVIARLRDVLPGSYAFGLTGRDPQGTELPPGTYRLQLVAWPVNEGAPTRVTLPFSIR